MADWATLWAGVAACALVLYVPGVLFCRAARLPGPLAVAFAPALSLPLYTALGIVLVKVGITGSWLALALSLAAAGALCWGASAMVARRRGKRSASESGGAPASKRSARRSTRFDWLCLAAYAACGLAAIAVFFVGSLGSPESFLKEIDNGTHLSMMRAIADSGNYSVLDTSYYLPSERSIDPWPSTSFYPAAWHLVGALAMDALDLPATVAANAMNVCCAGIVFPVSAFALVRQLFGESRRAVPLGALIVCAFAAFPWRFLVFGPLYPNLFACALVPLVAASFVGLTAPREDAAALRGSKGRVRRGSLAALFVAASVAAALAQPNAIFTAAVVLAPYCVYRVGSAAWGARLPASRLARASLAAAGGAAVVVAAAAVWTVLYRSPAFASVVAFNWAAYLEPFEAVRHAALLSFRSTPEQAVLAGLVALGALRTLRDRRWLWLVFAHVLLCFIFVVSASTEGPLKHLLAGFWYCDPSRLGASVVFTAFPLAALGLDAVIGALWAAGRAAARGLGPCGRNRVRAAAAAAGALAVAACAIAVYAPAPPSQASSANEGALERMSAQVADQNDDQSRDNVYGADERAFVARVRDLVGPDELVINMPHDGSAFAWAVSDLRTYYRSFGNGGAPETVESLLIRTRLKDVASSRAVRSAVRGIGAHYLLMLDQGHGAAEGSEWLMAYDGGSWQGIEPITDATPGFEVVLVEGDMRLYRIVAAE